MTRKSQYPVAPLFINRWSSRAMSGESIAHEQLMSLFEAAKWAPSSANGQPWRFIYAQRDTPAWNTFFNLLVPRNQLWAAQAAVLILIISRERLERNNEPAKTHSFDTGAAWMSLVLQASIDGLLVRGIGGFDYNRARTELGIPDGYTIEAMCAVGKQGKKEDVPADFQDREVPSSRKDLAEIVFEGSFKDKK